MNANKDAFSMRINGLSVLMLMILLCITVFAALALVSANSELTLSQKNAEYISDYAECNRDAQHVLAEVADAIADGNRTMTDISGVIVVDNNGTLVISFESEMHGNIKIQAEYRFENNVLSLVSYKTVIIDDASTDSLSAAQ